MSLPLTGSQTVGPYFSIGMESLCSNTVPVAETEIELTVEGRLLDGEGQPIPDGVLELWQADASGSYSQRAAASPGEALGFARVKTGPDGGFRFTTAKPGAVAYDEKRMQAPHIVVLVYMRGLLRHLVTRMYFEGEAMNGDDPVLNLVPEARRHTLMAKATATPGTLRWEIVMGNAGTESADETVFFAW